MKFDVVVGNPPYQSVTDSGSSIWPKFADLAFLLVVDNGVVGLVHPPSFIGKHRTKKTYGCFAKYQIEEIHLFDNTQVAKHFKAGTRICWYLATKSSPSRPTTVVGYHDGKTVSVTVDFQSLTCLPRVITEESMSIHGKLVNAPKMSFKQVRELHYFTMKKRNNVSETRSADFPFKSFFSHKIIRYANYQCSDYHQVKVMIPQTSTIDNTFVGKDCNVSEDLYYVIAPSLIDGERIRDVLATSDLYRYIGKMYRTGRNLGDALQMDIWPSIDYAVDLNNDELEFVKQALI